MEGEVFLQHITAPAEYQVTLPTTVFGSLLPNIPITGTITIGVIGPGLIAQTSTGPVPVAGGFTAPITITLTQPTPSIVVSSEHSHFFKNVPLTLYDRNLQVRQDAKEMNQNTNRVLPSRRVHGMH